MNAEYAYVYVNTPDGEQPYAILASHEETITQIETWHAAYPGCAVWGIVVAGTGGWDEATTATLPYYDAGGRLVTA